MKLSLRQAVTKCRKQWAWIAKHPTNDKDDYFKAHPRLKVPYATCYFCEYVPRSDIRIGCGKCPGLGVLWGVCCFDKYSPYVNWEEAYGDGGYKATAKYARQMVKGCDKILKRLDDGRKVLVIWKDDPTDYDTVLRWDNRLYDDSEIADIKAWQYIEPPEEKLVCPRCGGKVIARENPFDVGYRVEHFSTATCFDGPLMDTAKEAIAEYMKWVKA